MKKDNKINEKNNAVKDYEFVEKFIAGEFNYISHRILKFVSPFVGGIVHASLPDYPDSYTFHAFFGTILGVAPTLVKYMGSSVISQCKEVFKRDINMIKNGDSGTLLESRLEKLDQAEREKAINHVNNFIKSDKNELSDYFVNEKNNFAFAGVISYAAGFCLKKMFS